MNDEHITHVERRYDGSYYFWCEADDCYTSGPAQRYHTETEAFYAAAEHERQPG